MSATTLGIVPAFSEARAPGQVIAGILEDVVDVVVVVDTASIDDTEANARVAGTSFESAGEPAIVLGAHVEDNFGNWKFVVSKESFSGFDPKPANVPGGRPTVIATKPGGERCTR